MKLFDFFSALSKEELRELKKAIQSPFLNGNKRMMSLFEVLRKQHPNFTNEQRFREKIFQKVFPEKSFDDFALRRIFTEMTQVIEEFLLIRHFRKNDLKKNEQLLKIFHSRELDRLKAAKIKQIHKKIDQTTFLDTAMLQTKYQLTTNLYRNSAMSYSDKHKNILEAIDFLDQYYILEKNLLLTELNVVERTTKDKKAVEIQKTILPLSQRFIEEGNINIQLSTDLLKMMDKNSPKIFQKVKKQFFETKEEFSFTNQKEIFFTLINYAVYHFNINTANFDVELFDLYKKGIENDFLLNDNGYFTSANFRNVIIIALKVNELDWARHFSSNYSEKLESQEILPLCNAYIAMKEEKFFQVVELLNAAHFSGLADTLTAKTTLLIAYFEISLQKDNFHSVLLSYMDSFLIYLKRKKLNTSKSLRYINLIKFIKKLSFIIEEKQLKTQRIVDLEKAVKEAKHLTSKKYLLDKIKELKKLK